MTVWFGSTTAALGLGNAAVTLAREELERAQRFRLEDDRTRYLAARMLLRHALSQAIDGAVAPADWQFGVLPTGKLIKAPGFPAIAFNIAHSGDAVAVAVSRDGEVGIDLEEMNANLPPPLDHVLTSVERSWLGGVPRERLRGAFITLWCAKEACAKALGLGVALEFERIGIDPAYLQVYCSPDVLPAGHRLRLDLRHVAAGGRWYCLSTAKLKPGNARLAVRYEYLAEAA